MDYMYHVIANLEKRFKSVDEVLSYYSPQHPIYPRIPATRMLCEDSMTPRICVAPTIEDCFTAMGADRFLRCMSCHLPFDEKECLEVYPILLLSFSPWEDYHAPSETEVPDAVVTNEHWLREAAYPETVDLLWLASDSTIWNEIWTEDNNAPGFGQGQEICTMVDYLEKPPVWGIHPWLDGNGHTLNGVSAAKYFERS